MERRETSLNNTSRESSCRCHQRFKKFNPSEAFVPTVLFSVLERVLKLTTNCHGVAYDFDYLPPCAEGDMDSPINCINGPIVCSYDAKGRGDGRIRK